MTASPRNWSSVCVPGSNAVSEMPVSRDIWRTWRSPGRVFGELFAMGPREDRALMFLMLGCLMFFLSQLPILQRRIVLEQAPLGVTGVEGLAPAATYVFFGAMMILPLLFYILAAVLTLIANAINGPVSGARGRVALFWAWLAASPAALLYGLLAGFNGPEEPGTKVIGALWLALFALFIWRGFQVAARETA